MMDHSSLRKLLHEISVAHPKAKGTSSGRANHLTTEGAQDKQADASSSDVIKRGEHPLWRF